MSRAIGRIAKGSHPWTSRDYHADIACEATQCPANRSGKCSMPSAVKIGPDFRCKTGAGLIEAIKNTPKRGLDGD